MTKKRIIQECHGCDAEYTVVFDTDIIDEDPLICPFCGEDILSEDENLDDDLDDDGDEQE